MVCRWNDAYKSKKDKIVSMMSTVHTGKITQSDKIHYATKEKILKPEVILDYNKSMGGVDNLSRCVIPYSVQRRGLKWYRKIAELFIEISVFNSFIVYKKSTVTKMSQLQYRQNLAKSIITQHLHGTRTFQTGHMSVKDCTPFRLIGKHFLRLIPVVPGEKRKRKRCIRCSALGKRSDCSYECSKCFVALCMEPCMEIYHTKQEITADLNPPEIETEEEIIEESSTSEDE